LLTEPTRASVGLARLERGQTLGRIQRVSECDLQIKLLLLARSAVGQAGEDVEALPKLCHRLSHGPPCDGLLARLEAVTDGLFDEARFRAMLRQSLGLHRSRNSPFRGVVVEPDIVEPTSISNSVSTGRGRNCTRRWAQISRCHR